MDVRVEVLKKNLPHSINTLTCKAETSEAEILSGSSTIIQSRPVFKFNFRIQPTRVLFLFIVANGEEEVAECYYPVTFNNKMNHLLRPIIPEISSKKIHVAYFVTDIPELCTEQVVGRITFKITHLIQDDSLESDTSWFSMAPRSDNNAEGEERGRSAVGSSTLQRLISREEAAVRPPYLKAPGETQAIFIIFHSVTTLMHGLTSGESILTLVCMGASSSIREDALFTEGDDSIHTIPTFKHVLLRCSKEDANQAVELHMADKREKRVLFSASFTHSDLVPLKHYNWEFNWRWLPGTYGFNPSHSLGNLEPNITASIVSWPSLSEYPSYEGLEIFIEELKLDRSEATKDIVLCCEVIGMESRETNSISSRGSNREGELDEPPSFNVAVMQDSTHSNPAYFFCSDEEHRDFQCIALTIYASIHNRDLWWKSRTKVFATITLPKDLRGLLSGSRYHEGVRWEVTGENITCSSATSFSLSAVSGILRWKSKLVPFLSQATISKKVQLPMLDDITGESAAELTADGIPDFQPIFSSDHRILSANESPGINGKLREAMTKMGSDILKLREDNRTLKKENMDYETHIKEMEASIIVTAADQKSLIHFTKEDLIYKLVQLSERLATEKRCNEDFQSKVHRLQDALVKKNHIESQFADLQQAHTAQQKLVMELQNKVAKYKKCFFACSKQGEAIGRIESVLSKHESISNREAVKALREELSASRLFLSTAQENHGQDAISEREIIIENLRGEVSRLTKKLREQGTKPFKPDLNPRQMELEIKLELSSAKEKAVINELKASAAKWSREKSRYELQIAELKRQILSHQYVSIEHNDSSRNEDPSPPGSQ